MILKSLLNKGDQRMGFDMLRKGKILWIGVPSPLQHNSSLPMAFNVEEEIQLASSSVRLSHIQNLKHRESTNLIPVNIFLDNGDVSSLLARLAMYPVKL